MKSNRLTVLAAEVKDKLALSATAERSAIEAAMAAGVALCEARTACAHGQWLPFLDAAGVPERKAQRYMRLARSGLKSDTVSDLGGIKATLRWLEQLRLPADGEFLIVTDRAALANGSGKAAFVWREDGGHIFSIFNLAESFVDTLRRPIIQSEAVLPALFCLFGYRCNDLEFTVVPNNSPALSQLVDPFEKFILALEEMADVPASGREVSA
jgi:hypothetical protein